MYLNKIPHPINFQYDLEESVSLEVSHFGEDVYRVAYRSSRWEGQESPARLTKLGWRKEKRGEVVLIGQGFEVRWEKERVLCTQEGRGFGVLGKGWVFNFEPNPHYRFYGLGEKAMPVEKTGVRTRFYNTDLWADFPPALYRDGNPDPLYCSIPYLLLDAGPAWIGILLSTPYPSFISLLAKDGIADSLHGPSPLTEWFSLGADGGLPELYLVVGEDPKTVTCRMQRLQGTVPLPPLWALGYHQSRWGYGSYTDLDALDRQFRDRDIPCDALWLDIDYMDGFRIFTWDEKKFSHPKNQVEDLKKRFRRVVPILNPGIKKEDSFDVYQEAREKDLLCYNPEGLLFTGIVWPGETVFPDFSLPETQEWWAERMKKYLSTGIEGLWLDMNDPSTGCVDPNSMLFNRGKEPHSAFRNAYCLGMQRAVWDGFHKTRPNQRPFLISRSAFVSSSRYGGIWTGDNWSNRHHLKLTIPLCLSLSLSGLPFCGADVPGFGGDAEPDLAVDWYKTSFLFPLFRNHSVKGSKPQEPWTFGDKASAVIQDYIRLRYRMLPYLYNLFFDQEESGEPILRPLFLEFPEEKEEAAPFLDSEFLVGRSVLQCPILEGEARELYLPGKNLRWYDWFQGTWEGGGQTLRKKDNFYGTPVFIREGGVVALQPQESNLIEKDLSAVEFHLFLRRDSEQTGAYRYRFDDGETYSYRKGIRTDFAFTATVSENTIRIRITEKSFHFKPCRMCFVVYDRFEKVVITDGIREEHLFAEKYGFNLPGKRLDLRRTRETVLRG
jgi:alpha-glucosidase